MFLRGLDWFCYQRFPFVWIRFSVVELNDKMMFCFSKECSHIFISSFAVALIKFRGHWSHPLEEALLHMPIWHPLFRSVFLSKWFCYWFLYLMQWITAYLGFAPFFDSFREIGWNALLLPLEVLLDFITWRGIKLAAWVKFTAPLFSKRGVFFFEHLLYSYAILWIVREIKMIGTQTW